jgi:hypothetical protein
MRARTVRTIGAAGPGAIIPLVRIDAAIEPTTASGRTVVLELLKTLDLAAIGPSIAVHFLEHRIGRRLLLLAFGRVIPSQCGEPGVLGIRTAGIELLQPAAKMIDEPGFGAAVTRPADYFLVPLQ